MNNEGMLSRICSKEHILVLLYITVFLLPLTPFLLYVPLTLAVILSGIRHFILGKREWKYGTLKWAGAAFLGFSLLSIVNSPDRMFSIFNWLFLPFMYAALYVLIVTYARDRTTQKRMVKIFFLAGTAVVLYGIWQYLHIEDMAADMAEMDWVDPKRFPLLYRRMYSTLENPNLCATYFLMTTSMAGAFTLITKERNKRLLLGASTVAFMLCLALTYSRGAWISLLFIALVYAIFYDKRLFGVFLVVPFVLYFYQGQMTERFLSLFSHQDTSIGMRFNLWAYTSRIIADHPLLGCGWGAFYKVYPEYDPFVKDAGITIFHAHNMYLSMMADVGIPGALSYFAFMFGHVRVAYRLMKIKSDDFARAVGLGTMAVLFSIAVDGIGDYTLFSKAVSLCFWGVMAMASAILEEDTGIEISSQREKTLV